MKYKDIKKIIVIILSILIVYSLIMFKNKPNRSIYSDMTFPYKANQDKIDLLTRNAHKLKYGMSKQEVLTLLGKPDLDNSTYSTVFGEVVGSGLFYIISQDKEYGSVIDKNTKSITVQFNLENKLIYAYGKKIDFFTDLPKK